MTKIAFGEAEGKPPAYTFCKRCRLSCCVDCWEHVTKKLEAIDDGRRTAMAHNVLHALRTRAFSSGVSWPRF